jgi:hypothetical protein
MRRMRIRETNRPSDSSGQGAQRPSSTSEEVAREMWLLVGIRERSCYTALRCYARADSRAEVEALNPLAAIIAERGNHKLEMPTERASKNWAFVVYPPLRERDSEPELQPIPFEPATV